ncbi:MAG: hypothetical protein ISF22_02480 [Methanomassiliicoccus sp.]|nr:hypothetical protein [Methanomassiliicoccus sp.]
MELKLDFVHDDGKESGICHVHKVSGAELRKVGEIKFSDESDKRWIRMVMIEDHPNVSVIS